MPMRKAPVVLTLWLALLALFAALAPVGASPYEVVSVAPSAPRAGDATRSVFLPRLTKPEELGCEDPFEPNDDAGQAISICEQPIQSYVCHPGDVDYFQTCGGYGGSLLSFSVDLYDLPADYDLFVFDGDQEIGRSQNVGTVPEHVYVTTGPRTGNSYLIRIVGAAGSFDARMPYSLRFTRNPVAATATPTPSATPSPVTGTVTRTPTLGPPPVLSVDPVISPTELLRQTITGTTDPGARVPIACETGIYRQIAAAGGFGIQIDLLPGATTHITVTAEIVANPSRHAVTTVDRLGQPLAIRHVNLTPTPSHTATPTSSSVPSATGTATLTDTHTATPSHTSTPTETPHVPDDAVLRILVPAEVSRDVPFDVEVSLLDGQGAPVAAYRGVVSFDVLPPTVQVDRLPSKYQFTSADGGKHVFAAVVPGSVGQFRIHGIDNASGFEATSDVVTVRANTPTPTESATTTSTLTPAPTATPTRTTTPTGTNSPTATPSPSPTVTGTFSPTSTPTHTRTATPVVSPTPTSPAGPYNRIIQQGYEGYHGASDTTIREGYPNNNYELAQTLVLVAARDNDAQVFLLGFDLTDIPAHATVSEANLELYVHADSSDTPIRVSGYRVLRQWSPAQATWLRAISGTSWAMPGCDQPGVDREAEPEVSTTVLRREDWVSLGVTALVQDWVRSPLNNFGLVFRAEADIVSEYRLNSSEFWKPELRPRLLVTYYLYPTPRRRRSRLSRLLARRRPRLRRRGRRHRQGQTRQQRQPR